MTEIVSDPGEHVAEAAARMVAAAPSRCHFSGVDLFADAESTVDEIVAGWERVISERRLARIQAGEMWEAA